MFYRMDDPHAAFSNREFEQERIGKHHPTCSCCGEKIYSRTAMMRDGEYMCHECFDNVYSEVELDEFI